MDAVKAIEIILKAVTALILAGVAVIKLIGSIDKAKKRQVSRRS